jgi:hypothetical protein
MTTIDPFSAEADQILAEAESASERMRAYLAAIKKSREEQPDRLAKARAEADEARGWAIIDEPWDSQWAAVPGYNANGELTAMLALPNITAKELFGARLAFDMLDAGEDSDRIEDVKCRYFTMVGGDPGMAFLLFAAALDTVASLVVPQMIDELETHASNYDVRVMLAEARTKSWNGRVAELRGPHDYPDGSGEA